MAARSHKVELDERWRNKIRVSMLLNHLRNHVLGRNNMSPTQVRAAEILLRKCLPDLASIEHSGEINHNYVARTPEIAPNTDAWQERHVPPTMQ